MNSEDENVDIIFLNLFNPVHELNYCPYRRDAS